MVYAEIKVAQRQLTNLQCHTIPRSPSFQEKLNYNNVVLVHGHLNPTQKVMSCRIEMVNLAAKLRCNGNGNLLSSLKGSKVKGSKLVFPRASGAMKSNCWAILTGSVYHWL